MLGIDIGTTQSKVSYITALGKPESIPNARGEQVTPSVVYKDPSGETLVGTDARP